MCARYPIYSNSTLLPVRGELLELAQHILEQMEVDAANEGGARLEIDRQMVGYHALHDPHATQFRDAGLSLSIARLIRRDQRHEGHARLLHESLLPGK